MANNADNLIKKNTLHLVKNIDVVKQELENKFKEFEKEKLNLDKALANDGNNVNIIEQLLKNINDRANNIEYSERKKEPNDKDMIEQAVISSLIDSYNKGEKNDIKEYIDSFYNDMKTKCERKINALDNKIKEYYDEKKDDNDNKKAISKYLKDNGLKIKKSDNKNEINNYIDLYNKAIDDYEKITEKDANTDICENIKKTIESMLVILENCTFINDKGEILVDKKEINELIISYKNKIEEVKDAQTIEENKNILYNILQDLYGVSNLIEARDFDDWFEEIANTYKSFNKLAGSYTKGLRNAANKVGLIYNVDYFISSKTDKLSENTDISNYKHILHNIANNKEILNENAITNELKAFSKELKKFTSSRSRGVEELFRSIKNYYYEKAESNDAQGKQIQFNKYLFMYIDKIELIETEKNNAFGLECYRYFAKKVKEIEELIKNIKGSLIQIQCRNDKIAQRMGYLITSQTFLNISKLTHSKHSVPGMFDVDNSVYIMYFDRKPCFGIFIMPIFAYTKALFAPYLKDLKKSLTSFLRDFNKK